jgi:3-oxoacyl-[acyl-carrier protein] reductase
MGNTNDAATVDLTGRVALVTGGSRGIGRAIAQALADAGARVALCARNKADAEAAAAEIGHDCLGLGCDVRDLEQVSATVARVAERFGGLDILVNNAGVGKFAHIAELEPEDWHATIDTNLTGVYHCCHEAVPLMRERGGYIINISSLAGKNAAKGGTAYNASKAGLNLFTEALMLDVRHQGIRVSTIMPGSVDTSFGRGSPGSRPWALRPEDVAAVVIHLLSHPDRSLPSAVEIRPAQPEKR